MAVATFIRLASCLISSRTELALHVNLDTLRKSPSFRSVSPEFLHDLVLKMRAYIFTPGDLICRKGESSCKPRAAFEHLFDDYASRNKGEVAREMFIIADGSPRGHRVRSLAV